METQGDGQYDATKGEGVQPADLGHAEPDTGQGDSAESEIPVGVDSLTDEQIQKAQEAGPADGGGGEGDEGGGGDDAIDVAAIMEDDAPDASGDDDADASGDDDADASGDDADADASLGESETEGNAADDAGDDATEKTEPEAQVAPNTGDA